MSDFWLKYNVLLLSAKVQIYPIFLMRMCRILDRRWFVSFFSSFSSLSITIIFAAHALETGAFWFMGEYLDSCILSVLVESAFAADLEIVPVGSWSDYTW